MQAPGPESGPPQDVRWVHEKIAYLQEQLSANPSQLQPPVAAVLSQLCTPTAACNTPVAAVLSQLCAAAGSSDHNPSFGGAAPAITVWKVPFKQEGGGDAGKGAAVLQRAGAQDKQEEGVDAGKSAALLPQLKPLSDDSQNQAVAGLLSLAQSLSRKRPASDLWAGHASSGGAASQGVHPALGHANMGQAAGSEKKHRPARGHGGAGGRHAEDTARGARASRGAGRTGTGKAAAGSAARGRTGDEGRGADRAEKERLAHEMAALLLEEEERASRLPQAQAGIGTVKGGRGGGKRGGNPAPSRHAARVVRAKKKDRANGKA